LARCAAAAPARLASAGLRPGRCCSSQGPTSGQRPTPRARSRCPSRCQATRAATAPARERAGERRPAPGARTSCGRRTGCGEHRRQARVALLPHAPRRQARLPPQLPRPVGANVGGPWHREAAADHACLRRPRNCCDACGTRAVTRAATLTSESKNAQHKQNSFAQLHRACCRRHQLRSSLALCIKERVCSHILSVSMASWRIRVILATACAILPLQQVHATHLPEAHVSHSQRTQC